MATTSPPTPTVAPDHLAASSATPAPARAFQRTALEIPFRREDPLLLLVTAATLLPTLLVVRFAGWAPGLSPVPWLALGGLLLGYLLARTHLFGTVAHLLALAAGLELLVFTYSATLPGASISERADALGARFAGWLAAALSGGASSDPLIFALAMGGLAILLGYASAWLIFRQRTPWLVVGLDGAALLVSLSYVPAARIWYVPPFLFAAGILLALHHALDRQAAWQRARLRVERAVLPAVLLATIGVLAVLLGIAWALPAGGSNPSVAADLSRVSAPLRSTQSSFDRLFAALNGTQSAAQGLSFSGSLEPRGSFDLGPTPVLRIHSPQPLYWRATTADTYTGQAMEATDVHTRTFRSGRNLISPTPLLKRVPVTASITVLASRSAVAFAPDEPLSLNVPVHVDFRSGLQDLAGLRPTTDLVQGQTYTVTSEVTDATPADLRAAGQDYPDWVRQRYLQIPSTLPARVVQLAQQAAIDGHNPYDKAAAIELYLRSNYTYSTHVPAPPAGRDWVDYFLFDSRTGYCDYFATAMTVMLRADGIPARVASGFAPGDYDPSSNSYIVRESHAHSWVEAYFPNYGWIVFEPSAIRSLPTRADGTQDTAPSAANASPTPAPSPTAAPTPSSPLNALQQLAQGSNPSDSGPLGWLRVAAVILGAMAALAAVVGGIVLALRYAWRRGLGALPWYQRPYVQLLRLAGWVGAYRPSQAATPYEVADALGRDIPVARRTIRHLAAAYVEGTYADREPTQTTLARWSREWRSLVRPLLGRRLRTLLGLNPPPAGPS